MITASLLIATLALFSILLFILGKDKRHKKFPKGPAGLPILGYIPWLGPKLHTELSQLSKKYGNIFSVKLGGEFFVVLNDYESVKKAMKMDAFAGRPVHMIAIEVFKNGIAYGQGPAWVEQRRFALRTLRDFGFGKRGMDVIIQENVDELVQYYRKTAGTPQRISDQLSLVILNLVWQLVTGRKVELGDPKPIKILKLGREGVMDKATNGPIYVMPWLARMFPKLTGLDSLYRTRDELYSLFMEIYDEHKERFNPGQEPQDYVDCYLQKMHDHKDDPESSFYREKGIASFKDSMTVFFLASSDTLTTSLEFTILYLLKWPEKMKKLRQEIDTILGRRPACSEDRIRLPYTEAVMQEALRLSSVLPGAVLHTTTEDVDFEGFFLPKGTVVYPNLYQVHRDPSYWPKSGEFWPERFLEPGLNGNLICRKDPRVLAFGTGKRECIAISMAQTEFVLILTRLIQNFDITGVGQLPDIEVKTCFVLQPDEFQVVFTPRD